MIQLYYFPNSCAMSEHIVLEWIGTDYEAIKATYGSDEYKKIAPKWAVPAMKVDGGATMTQNDALLKYLARKYPEAKLGSDGTLEWEFELDNILAQLGGDLHAAFVPIFVPQAFTTQSDEVSLEAVKLAAHARIERQMNYLDELLEWKTYLLGDNKSVADAYAFTLARWSFNIPKTLEEYPNIKRFHDTMLQDSAVQKVLAIHNPEA